MAAGYQGKDAGVEAIADETDDEVTERWLREAREENVKLRKRIAELEKDLAEVAAFWANVRAVAEEVRLWPAERREQAKVAIHGNRR